MGVQNIMGEIRSAENEIQDEKFKFNLGVGDGSEDGIDIQINITNKDEIKPTNYNYYPVLDVSLIPDTDTESESDSLDIDPVLDVTKISFDSEEDADYTEYDDENQPSLINSSSLVQDNDQVLSVKSELSSQGELKKEEYDYQNEDYENDEYENDLYGGEFRRPDYEETITDFYEDVNEKPTTIVTIDDLDKESLTEDQELDTPDEESSTEDQELDTPDKETTSKDQELETQDEESFIEDQEEDTPDEERATKDQEEGTPHSIEDQELDTQVEENTTEDQDLDTPDEEITTEDQKLVIPDEERSIEDQGRFTPNEEYTTEDQELVVPDKEWSFEDKGLDIPNEEYTTEDQELVTLDEERSFEDQGHDTPNEEYTTESQGLDTPNEESTTKDKELDTPEEETTTKDQEEDTPDEESTTEDQELVIPEEEDGAEDQGLDTPDDENSIIEQKIDTLNEKSSIEDQEQDIPDEDYNTKDQKVNTADEESSIEDQEIDTSDKESSIEDQKQDIPDEESYFEDQDYFTGERKEILFQDLEPKTIPSLIESTINGFQDEVIIDEDTDLEPDKLFRGISELEEEYTDEGFARTFSNEVLRTSTAKVNTGTVRGKVLKTLTGLEITWYPGIPYAEPPVGDLRFQVARRKSSWTGVLEGRERVKCVQASSFNVEGEEDCLYLNIWVPETRNSTQLLPVMVWIHGGFFLFGSGDAEYQSFHRLVEKNVIVVSINYRLGALGFLCLGNDMSGGNLGLRDQKLALEWVQQNILNFGGDPGRVTVFGHGSGAMSTQVHLLSPSSRRFISGAILQSGSLLYKTKFEQVTEDVIKSSRRLADSFGCFGLNTLNCLRNISANLLTRKSVARDETFNESGIYSNSSWFWLPVQDGNFSRDPLIPKPPVEIILSGEYLNVPVLTGLVEGEGSLYLTPIQDSIREIEKMWKLLGPSYLLQTSPGLISDEDVLVANTLTRFYVGRSNLSAADRMDLQDMFSDAYFSVPVLLNAELMSRSGTKTFCYILKETIKDEETPSFGHGDDLVYLFSREERIEQKRISDLMVSAWTNFARSRNPDSEMNISWAEYTQKSKSCLLLTNEPTMETNSYPERMLIWRKLVWDPILLSLAPKPKPICPPPPPPPKCPSPTLRPTQPIHSSPTHRPHSPHIPSRPFLVPYVPAWIHPYPAYTHYHSGR
ncbi:uncharacterized protein LOC111698863 isoform X4 [Eurytemora carolleeae]|uniref:uncharacterized protein LOC111698863 isoform X4 n=1 Tax=Eurytemora carolleeae TaxID=1294199 RepID=UPI000C77B430|nr:uncharacterized protein LOC111698863 isoform X4 [Eurytemora carolleeae]|eukprot:XP_023325100.1 uncharacterized protein LOC111698863 isoform X4 [Eurytemora affinis]